MTASEPFNPHIEVLPAADLAIAQAINVILVGLIAISAGVLTFHRLPSWLYGGLGLLLAIIWFSALAILIRLLGAAFPPRRSRPKVQTRETESSTRG